MILLPFFVVLFISVAMSVWASRKEGDYFLAGRSVGFLPLFGTFLGTQVGVGFVLGGADAVWEQGLPGALYGIRLALGMLVLGLGYSKRLRMLDVRTLPDLLEKSYGSAHFKRLASLLSILSMGGILIAQAVGLHKFLLSLGLGSDWIFFVSWGSVVLYTTFGGFLAVVWTDLIQSLAIVGILCVVFFQTLLPQWADIVQHAQSMPLAFDEKAFSSFLMPICFIFVAEHMAQRCFAARTPRVASKAAMATALCLIALSVIPIACGVLGHSMGFSLKNGSIFMQVMRAMSSPAMFAFVSSSILLAIVSTTSSILLAISSNATQDTGLQIERGRIITLCVGLVATVGYCLQDNIISWIVAGYEVSVSVLFVPLVAAVFCDKRRLSRRAAWMSCSCGFVGFWISHLFLGGLWYALTPLLLSSTGFVWGGYLEKQSLASQVVIE